MILFIIYLIKNCTYIRKFGEEVGGWCTLDCRGGYSTSFWKDIRKELDTFLSHVVFSIGNGRRICFWKDIWCIEEALCDSFSFLICFGNLQRC